MKSGAMFGNLRKYRKPEYCQAHRDLSFETLYEEGQYEIFAVTMIRVTPGLSGYLNLWDLDSADRAVRRETISQLRKNSQYYSTLKVGEEDQLLLLITCEGDDDQRLVVAAKRVEKVKKENGYSKV
jgi:sortase B